MEYNFVAPLNLQARPISNLQTNFKKLWKKAESECSSYKQEMNTEMKLNKISIKKLGCQNSYLGIGS